MRIAIIDMGTNSIRYSIYEVVSSTQAELIYKQKDMIRPGRGVFTSGLINSESRERIVDSFLDWKKISEKYAVDRTVAIATSALRTAKNADEIVDAVHAKTGFRIRVISGAEEARLIAKGILNSESKLGPKTAFVDIGGGSTEISLVERNEIVWSHSFPVGCQRLKQMFPEINPPNEMEIRAQEIKALRGKVRSKLSGLEKHLKGQSYPVLIGTAGTIKALGRILTLRNSRKKDQDEYVKNLAMTPSIMEFSFVDLKELNGQLETASRAHLSFLEGLEPKRRDLIIPGAILLEEVCSLLKGHTIRTSAKSLRDGVLLSQLESEPSLVNA